MPPPLILAIFIYTACRSYSLVYTWLGVPLEYFAPLAWQIWMFPVVFFTIRNIFYPSKSKKNYSIFLVILGFLISLLGTLSQLNTAHYAGFAIVSAGLLPPHWAVLPWLLIAVTWWPAFTWINLYYFPEYTSLLRILISLLASISITCILLKDTKEKMHETE